MVEKYTFNSCFAPLIEEHIMLKRQQGFFYDDAAYNLKKFDEFCVKLGVTDPVITKELTDSWGEIRDTESKSHQSKRISIVRQLSLYMLSQGIDSYIPNHFYNCEHRVAHVMDDDEIAAFFEQIDSYHPAQDNSPFRRLSVEYRVLFRLILCCGLRISEARKLRIQDIDLKSRKLKIMQSKGRKDRIIYIDLDLCGICIQYRKLMKDVFKTESLWFFPARNPNDALTNCTIDSRFRKAWKNTPYYASSDKQPTVHSLRHSFVVKRMNLWMEENIPLETMMPYLSKYLGHTSTSDTFYYYHQVETAFKIIREKDRSSSKVIPEVNADEE